ncbi:4969_t:CDS:2 [Entrophospora sp. SA101]|nr:4969_t:CDS:2 [Entrophospora sp. SA101]
MLSSVKSFLWKSDMNYDERQDYNATIALVNERTGGTTQNSVVLSGSPDSNQNNSSTGYNVGTNSFNTTPTGPFIPIPPRQQQQQQQTPHNATPNTGGTTDTSNNNNNNTTTATTTTTATNVITSSAPNNTNNTPVLSNITTSIAVGSTFLNWEQVDEVLELYGREKGFVVRKKRVERDDMGMVRKRTYDCEHGGRYTPKKKAAIHEQRNRTSKRIECGWHINLSFPKTSSHITAASPKNRNLPKAVLEDIEFYTIHGNLGVTTQRQLLKAKYPNHQLPARDISNAVQKFKGVIDLKSLDNDAPKLWIWELARKATQIALDHQDNTLEELLKSYIREKEDPVLLIWGVLVISVVLAM